MSQLKIKEKKNPFAFLANLITILILVVAIGVCAYAGWNLYKIFSEYKAGSDEYAKISDMVVTEKQAEVKDETWVDKETKKKVWTAPLEIDYDKLSEINPDFVGWLYVEALPDISYPIVHYKDNDYYLHRTFEKTDNFAGCLFVNSYNMGDFTDQNTIIYGHNMKNGSMFGKLKNFSDPEVFKKSRYFWIFTPDFIYQYRIFSASVVDKTGLTYQISFTDDEFDQFISRAYSNSVVDNQGVTVTKEDRIVTLSTCTGDDSTRFVVMGKLAQIYAAG